MGFPLGDILHTEMKLSSIKRELDHLSIGIFQVVDFCQETLTFSHQSFSTALIASCWRKSSSWTVISERRTIPLSENVTFMAIRSMTPSGKKITEMGVFFVCFGRPGFSEDRHKTLHFHPPIQKHNSTVAHNKWYINKQQNIVFLMLFISLQSHNSTPSYSCGKTPYFDAFHRECAIFFRKKAGTCGT